MTIRSGSHAVKPPLIGTVRGYLSSTLSNQENLTPPALKSSKMAVRCPSYPSNHYIVSLEHQKDPKALPSSIAVLVLPQPVDPASHSIYGCYLIFAHLSSLNSA